MESQKKKYDTWCDETEKNSGLDHSSTSIEKEDTEYHYLIFTGDGLGNYESCKFIAEFPDVKMAADYVKFMGGKKRYQGKGIFITKKKCNRVILKEEELDGVISALGEVLMDDGKWLDY